MSKELFLENGLASLRAVRFAEAIRHLKAALELDQDYANAWYRLATAHEGLGQYREAIEALRKARALDPAEYDTIATFAIGNCERELGEHEAALQSYEAALASGPTLTRIWHNYARFNAELGRYEQARAAFARLAELQPEQASAWLWQGYCLERLGQDQAAESCYKRIGNDPEAAETWMVVGTDELRRRRLNEALRAFDRAIAAKPDWGIAHSHRAICLTELGRSGEALAAVRRAVSLDSRLALNSLVHQASIHIRSGQPKAAQEVYARAAVIEPRSALEHAARCVALGALGRVDEALASIAQARRLEPARHDFLFCEAVCLQRSGRREEALAAYEVLLAQAPSYVQAWGKLAYCLGESGDYQRALALCEKARVDGVASIDLSFVHGVALFAVGRIAEAVPHLEAVVAAEDTGDNAWMYLARSHLLLKNPRAALACFDRLLALKPASDDVWLGRSIAQEDLGSVDAAESSRMTGYAMHLLAQDDASQAFGYLVGAVERDPGNWQALRAQADMLIQTGRPDEGLERLARVVEIQPDAADAWQTRGALLGKLGRLQEALDCSRRAVDLDPRSARALRNHGFDLLEVGQANEAQAVFVRALELDGESANAWYGKGVALARTGVVHEAIDAFRRCLAIDERDVEAWSDLGTCLAHLRRFREANEAWRRLTELAPGRQPKQHLNLAGESSLLQLSSHQAYACLRAGDFSGAAQAFDISLAADPERVDLLIDRGICAEQLEGPAAAIEWFRKALQHDQEDIGAHYNLAVSLMHLEYHEDAAKAFAHVIALHGARGLPVDADLMHAHHNLGSCLMQLQRQEDALDQFDVVARLARTESGHWQEEARRAESLKRVMFGASG
jgi:tetratricopeptide (TPR) repeat protein